MSLNASIISFLTNVAPYCISLIQIWLPICSGKIAVPKLCSGIIMYNWLQNRYCLPKHLTLCYKFRTMAILITIHPSYTFCHQCTAACSRNFSNTAFLANIYCTHEQLILGLRLLDNMVLGEYSKHHIHKYKISNVVDRARYICFIA